MGRVIQIPEETFDVLNSMYKHIYSHKVDKEFMKELNNLIKHFKDEDKSLKAKKLVLNTEGRRHKNVLIEYNALEKKDIYLKGYLIKLYNDLEKKK